jgi:hypothetical protein
MDFYRAEILMDNAKAWGEKEQEHRKAEEKQQSEGMADYSPSSMMSSAKNMFKSSAAGMPKLGGNFKL